MSAAADTGGLGGRMGRLLDLLERGLLRLLGTGTSPWRLVAGWVLTRAVLLILFSHAWHEISSDVDYYFRHLEDADGNLLGTLREYPPPAVLVVALPWLVAGSSDLVYKGLFIGLMLVVDALLTWALVRCRGDRRGAVLWLAGGLACGPLMLLRFDLVPGAAMAVALLVLVRRPRVAALLTVGAASVKLWPALLLPALAAPRATRRRVLVTAVVAGAVVAVSMLAAVGLDRILSPLHYQSDRGLQIESLVAYPLLVMWSLVHAPWTTYFSDFIAQEIRGPGDALMLGVSSLATLVALVLIATLAVRLWRRADDVTTASVGWVMLASSGMLVLANKVFSPQYLLWLLPVAVAVVALSGQRAARHYALLLSIAALVGTAIYPPIYSWGSDPGTGNSFAVAVFGVRMLFVVAAVVLSVREAWRVTAPRPARVVDRVA